MAHMTEFHIWVHGPFKADDNALSTIITRLGKTKEDKKKSKKERREQEEWGICREGTNTRIMACDLCLLFTSHVLSLLH